MQIFSDLQLHSRFSRAVSKQMTLSNIAQWSRKKGIHLVATGDWTHPLWMREITEQLKELGNGFLRLKHEKYSLPLFLLATEVSCIYSQGGRGRRIHILIWVPSLKSAVKINQQLTKQGCNLMSDGRPIIGLSSIQVAELVLSIEPQAMIIPAHCWTPWFGMYGSMSGFNTIEETFGPYAKDIYAVETGLSSDPSMNWQIKELDNRTIVSFSDAHSGPKIGREATVFEFDGDISRFHYDYLYESIKQQNNIAYTIEFFPEEGKYHYSGHRACGIRWGPEETNLKGTVCPVCGKQLTQGVVQRVAELALRNTAKLQLYKDSNMTKSRLFPKRPSYRMIVPLQEILAECLGSAATSKTVIRLYDHMIETLGTEFDILLKVTEDEISKIAGDRVAQGIRKVRQQDIYIDPGYDGVFGVVQIWQKGEIKPLINIPIFNRFARIQV